MAVTRSATAFRANRWAYACGMALKRSYRRINAFESRFAERVAAVGVPVGKPLVRGGFLIGKLALLGVLFFISFWLLISVCMLIAFAATQPLRGASDIPNVDDLYHPMHRSYWPEFYDKWGSLK
ncbi:DUF3742 family protein [Pseudomonas borbori]|uniref:DUF3742 family protein n=1 Tax=Pseudomonas borbori TaxID=289003 RepID=A0A1I5WHX0_9PSED|nr:DUF3742 family protein [Pseudomonas borbori]SFQ19267.1 Protein of unknown function [Pseudomonas borbori]